MAARASKSRLAGQLGKTALCVDFVGSAPWNLRDLLETPKYWGVGAAVQETAIEFSTQWEIRWEDRVAFFQQSGPF